MSNRSQERQAHFGPFQFDLVSRELKKNGVRLPLEDKPAQVLSALVSRPGLVVSREELRNLLWPNGVHVDYQHGLNKSINKLRFVLGDDSSKPRYIETLSRRGYRFIAKVEVRVLIVEDPVSKVQEKDQAAASAVGVAPEAVSEIRTPQRRLGNRFRLQPSLRPMLFAAATTLAAILLTAITLTHQAPGRNSRPQSLKTVISLPLELRLISVGENAGIALSPDGTRTVFSAVGPSGSSMLWMRSLDSLTPRAVPGTESGGSPFWSPDGTQVGFFTDRELKTVNLKDGTVKGLCSVSSSRGGSWSKDDVIIFARETRTPIYKIPANGGTPVPVTKLDGKRFTTHRWPRWLPDGRHFIFLAASHDSPASSGVLFLGSIDGAEAKVLGEADSNAVPGAGDLLYLSRGKLIAQRLDVETATLQASAIILAEGVDYEPGAWHGTFDATDDALLYRPQLEGASGQTLAWYDREGHWLKNASEPGIFFSAQLSPDGNNIAVVCGDPAMNLCIIHADRTVTQLTNKPIISWMVWSPDGTEIAYGRHEESASTLVVKSLATKAPERIFAGPADGPLSWHPDGRHMLISRLIDDHKSELDVLDLATNTVHPYLPAQAEFRDGRFSPDGKWIAHTSLESGTEEVYLSSYPVPSAQYRVSTSGGRSPRWRSDGRELYFLGLDDTLNAVELAEIGHVPTFSPPHPLFRPQIFPFPSSRQSFDVSADGKRFIINVVGSQNRSDLVLVRNWSH
jgi:Tol biopolymer transport system component/DNA-binding winged helix-turn-helix (wHTH) protein